MKIKLKRQPEQQTLALPTRISFMPNLSTPAKGRRKAQG